MDMNVWAPILLVSIPLIPTAIGLILQAVKDGKEAKLSRDKDIRDGLVGINDRLQAENTRLQARVIELEQALIERTDQNGQLQQESVDNEARIRSMQYEKEDMLRKLATYETTKPIRRKTKAEVDKNTQRPDEVDLDTSTRKDEIAKKTQEAIAEIKSKSITNGSMTVKQGE